jgi:hypothetical protein
MSINGMTLTWVDKISYLGIVIVIVKDKYFTADSTPKRRNFYSSVNCIFNKSHMILSHASAEAQGNVVRAICLSKVNPHF